MAPVEHSNRINTLIKKKLRGFGPLANYADTLITLHYIRICLTTQHCADTSSTVGYLDRHVVIKSRHTPTEHNHTPVGSSNILIVRVSLILRVVRNAGSRNHYTAGATAT
jgi:hypothetical protein